MLSVRQKVESQNGGNKETKHAKFSEKLTFLTPQRRTRTCAYQWVKNVRFFGKFGVFCFFATSVLRFAFFAVLPTICRITDNIPYYRRFAFFAVLPTIFRWLIKSNLKRSYEIVPEL